MTKNSILNQPHRAITVYHLETRNAVNDCVDEWYTSKAKAEAALAREIDGDDSLALIEGGFTSSSGIYLSRGPVIKDEDIEPYNKETGTHYESWREAAIDQWGFTAEWGCCNAMARLTRHEAIKLEDGKVYLLKRII